LEQSLQIAIASCAQFRSDPDQPAWDEIRAAKPDVLLLLGDNIYLKKDSHRKPDRLADELRGLYKEQFLQPRFAALLADLRQRGGQLVATYDDHDFLGNNRYGADADNLSLRETARSEFIAAFAPRQTGADVYALYHLGKADAAPLVDLVVLDARFYRTDPADDSPGRDAMLGAAQWQWLEQVVTSSKARYLVVASSTTVHAIKDENWPQYPQAHQRLLQLLRGRPGALVVSGDVHENLAQGHDGVVEITSSGVARRKVFGTKMLRNWGLLEFGAAALRVRLQSPDPKWQRDITLSLNHWSLP
jgi:alkaline phosphatase D